VKKVFLSPEAEESIFEISDFLWIHWSPKVALNFEQSVLKAFKRIAKNPESFQFDEKIGARKYFINKLTVLIYQVRDNKVEIIQAFDARQNYQDKDTWK